MIHERVHDFVPLQEAAQYRSDRCLAMFARNAKIAIEPLSLDVVRHALRLCVSSWCQRKKTSDETEQKKEESANVGEEFCEDDSRRVLFPSNLESDEVLLLRRTNW